MKQSVTATEARARKQEGGFIPAYSPAHRASKKEAARRDIMWNGLSNGDEIAKARRRQRIKW